MTGPLSRRRLLALVGTGATASIAGCPSSLDMGLPDSTETGGEGQNGETPTDGGAMPSSTVEALSLTKIGTETYASGQGEVVAYRHDLGAPTMVERFATATDTVLPAGRNLVAGDLGPEEVNVPVANAPRVSAERAGVFVPEGARKDQVAAADVLVFVPGTELGRVTVANDATQLLRGEQSMPQSKYLPDWLWEYDTGWTEATTWTASDNWIPDPGWRATSEWVPSGDPGAAPVVLTGDVSGVGSGAGESLSAGTTLSGEHALFAVPGSMALPDTTWPPAGVFNTGVPSPMGASSAGVAMLRGPEVQPGSVLTEKAGKRALSLVATGGTQPVEVQAGPTRLDGTDHFKPESGVYQGQPLGGGAEMRTYGGVVSGIFGPFAIVVHVMLPGSGDSPLSAVIGVDVAAVGSTALFENGAYGRVFARSRLHNSRAFTWVAAGGTISP